MGQRLNIEIVKGDNVLANAYYHWSGYSNSAIDLVECIIRYYDYADKYHHENDTLFAIKLLEKTGAGLTEDEVEYVKKKYGETKLSDCKGRNNGLIAITKKGIEETREWEEARVTIDIDTKTFDFKRAMWKLDKSEIKECIEEGKIFYEINYDLKNIEFEKVFDLKALIDKMCYLRQYDLKNNFDNTYFTLIE